MSFKCHEFADGSIVVIDIPQRLTLDTADQLKQLLKDYVEKDVVRFVINLAQTDYMDSSGLGAIVSKIAQTRANNGDIRLAAVSDYVANLLELTHIIQILQVFDTPDEAVTSFGV